MRRLTRAKNGILRGAPWQFACLLLVSMLTGGCASPVRVPVIDVSQPGWQLQQGTAIWTRKNNSPEVSGELLVASHAQGRSFIQFTKANFPIVTASSTTTNWAIEFVSRGYVFSGTGEPPARYAWLLLPRALRGDALPDRWLFTKDHEGSWRLANSKTGEVVEGFLSP